MTTIKDRNHQIVIKGLNPNFILERTVNSSTLKPGMAVSNYGESDTKSIHPAIAGQQVLGVALEHVNDDKLAGTNRDTLDIDTVYVTASSVRVAICGSGMVCLMLLAGQATTATIYGGDEVTIDTTSAGYCMLTASTANAVNTTSEFSKIGKSIERNTGGSAAGVIAVVI